MHIGRIHNIQLRRCVFNPLINSFLCFWLVIYDWPCCNSLIGILFHVMWNNVPVDMEQRSSLYVTGFQLIYYDMAIQ